MNGTYRIYDNGHLLAEIPNVITNDGKRLITRYLAKNNGGWAGAMVVGSGRSVPAATDATLNFEYARFPVYYSYGFYDDVAVAYKIIFKAIMPETFAGAIEEIGLYSTLQTGPTYSGEFSLFDNLSDWTQTTFAANDVVEQPSIASIASGAESRIKTGTIGYKVIDTKVGNFYRDFSMVDFNAYAATDGFALAYGLGTSATIQIRFEKDASNYYYKDVTGGTSSDYNIYTFARPTLKVGTVAWSEVVGIRIVISANSGGVWLDGLRPVVINNYNEDYGLVSRARSATEDTLLKRAGSRLDLEYEVTLAL
jgi:hypothetical protein